MIHLQMALTGLAHMTPIGLTLLLSENTPIALAGLLFLAPVVLALCSPLYWMTKPNSSQKSKVFAFALAMLPVWLSSEFSKELGGWVNVLFYLPIVMITINLSRNAPSDKEEGKN